MKCSVAMATYNGEKYIAQQLESIVKQTMPVDEIIIVDDCSSDASGAIVKSFQEKYPIIKFYQNEKNLGYKKNFHNAVQQTSGDYVFLCDQDDVWLEDKVADVMKAFAQTNADVICTQYELIDANGDLIEHPERYEIDGRKQRGRGLYTKISTQKLVIKSEFPGCSCCMSRSVKDAFLKQEWDIPHDLVILMLGSFLRGTVFCNKMTMQYRLHGDNTIGFQRKTGKFELGLGVIKIILKPCTTGMFYFLKQVQKTIKVKHAWWYRLLCQLQVPLIYYKFTMM